MPEQQHHVSRFEFLAMTAAEAERAKASDDILVYAGAKLVLAFAKELLFMEDHEAQRKITDLITHP